MIAERNVCTMLSIKTINQGHRRRSSVFINLAARLTSLVALLLTVAAFDRLKLTDRARKCIFRVFGGTNFENSSPGGAFVGSSCAPVCPKNWIRHCSYFLRTWNIWHNISELKIHRWYNVQQLILLVKQWPLINNTSDFLGAVQFEGVLGKRAGAESSLCFGLLLCIFKLINCKTWRLKKYSARKTTQKLFRKIEFLLSLWFQVVGTTKTNDDFYAPFSRVPALGWR